MAHMVFYICGALAWQLADGVSEVDIQGHSGYDNFFRILSCLAHTVVLRVCYNRAGAGDWLMILLVLALAITLIVMVHAFCRAYGVLHIQWSCISAGVWLIVYMYGTAGVPEILPVSTFAT